MRTLARAVVCDDLRGEVSLPGLLFLGATPTRSPRRWSLFLTSTVSTMRTLARAACDDLRGKVSLPGLLNILCPAQAQVPVSCFSGGV